MAKDKVLDKTQVTPAPKRRPWQIDNIDESVVQESSIETVTEPEAEPDSPTEPQVEQKPEPKSFSKKS